MGEIKISIIVPVYNGQKYIRTCLDSILNQTYKNIELIIINDGSTDNSKTIIEEYVKRDKRIVAYHQNNKGVSDARNKGLKYATGKWIWFVDSDDIPSKSFLSEVFKINLKRETDIIVGNYMKVFPDCKIENVILDEQGYIQNKDFPVLLDIH